MTHFLTRTLLGAVTCAFVAMTANAQVTQDKFATEYAKNKNKLGLFLDSEELSKAKARYGMNGYALAFQSDNNVCLQKTDGTYGGWCTNDEFPDWKKTAKVKFVQGSLQAMDDKGKVIWQTRGTVKDPYARLIISPEGKLMIINAAGAVYWFRPNKK
jgi:hypothetical protein